jgi:membrane protease YdiL (CAAX protease family)
MNESQTSTSQIRSSPERPAGLSVLCIIVYLTLDLVWIRLPWPQGYVWQNYKMAILRLVFLAGLGLLLSCRGNPAAFLHYCLGRIVPAGRHLTTILLLLLAMVGVSAAVDWLWLRPESATPFTFDTFVSECCVAPVNEEIVFRGVFLSLLLTQPQLSRTGAIILSAMVFAGIHLPLAWQIAPLLTIGIISGLIFYRTRCVLLCVAYHATSNALHLWPVNHWW